MSKSNIRCRGTRIRCRNRFRYRVLGFGFDIQYPVFGLFWAILAYLASLSNAYRFWVLDIRIPILSIKFESDSNTEYRNRTRFRNRIFGAGVLESDVGTDSDTEYSDSVLVFGIPSADSVSESAVDLHSAGARYKQMADHSRR